MAIVYSATLAPTKPELLATWLPLQSWFSEKSTAIDVLGAYRLDDPYGEVGIETHLVRGASGKVYQVPLTYRGEEMPNSGAYLVTEMSHSVLGHRWVYDATADPVAVAELVRAIVTGGRQADEYVDGATTPAPVSVEVKGTGSQVQAPQATLVGLKTQGAITRIQTDSLALDLYRVVSGVHDHTLRLDAVSGFDGAPATLASVVSA